MGGGRGGDVLLSGGGGKGLRLIEQRERERKGGLPEWEREREKGWAGGKERGR